MNQTKKEKLEEYMRNAKKIYTFLKPALKETIRDVRNVCIGSAIGTTIIVGCATLIDLVPKNPKYNSSGWHVETQRQYTELTSQNSKIRIEVVNAARNYRIVDVNADGIADSSYRFNVRPSVHRVQKASELEKKIFSQTYNNL